MERCWILLGMMGSGKTTLGREMAATSGRAFVDTDQLIQQRVCHTIPQIFKLYGEPAFREHETSTLRSLQPSASILSTGGGIVMREENWTELRRLGITVYLDIPLDVLKSRLQAGRKRRPLLEGEDWEGDLEKLYAERKGLYERADLRFTPEREEIAHTAAQLLRRLQEAS